MFEIIVYILEYIQYSIPIDQKFEHRISKNNKNNKNYHGY